MILLYKYLGFDRVSQIDYSHASNSGAVNANDHDIFTYDVSDKVIQRHSDINFMWLLGDALING